MLAKILRISSLLALASLASASTAAAQGHGLAADTAPTFQPFGEFSGAWQSGNLLTEGVLSGALTDARGMPLWMMTTTLNEVGALEGSLVPMLYNGNPVLGMGELELVGSADLDISGSGTFHMVIYEQPELLPVNGDEPIYALGFVSGVLENGRLGSSKSSQDSSVSSADQRSRALQGLPSGIIKSQEQSDVQVDGISSAGQRARALQGLPSGTIKSQEQSDVQVDGISSAGQRARALQGLPSGVIKTLIQSDILMDDMSSAGPRGAASQGLPGGAIQDPHDSAIGVSSMSSAGSYSAAGVGAPQSSGAGGGGYDRAALRRGVVVDYGPSQGSNSDISSAGSYGSSSHQVPISGSGKASGSWSWITF